MVKIRATLAFRMILLGIFFLISTEVACSAEMPRNGHIRFDAGYRVDDFDWNIAGDRSGGNPDVLSELTWEDIEIYQLKVTGDYSCGSGDSRPFLLAKGSFAYGWIFDGENRDSDYAGDNRTLEWSRSESSADDGNTLDASAGIGLRFSILEGKWTVSPLVGWSYHEQNLTISDGFQVLSNQAIADAFFEPGILLSPVGPIVGLDSTYDARWYGPWAGFDLSFSASESFSLTAGAEYHWGWYEGEGVWNLRSDLAQDPSFEHEADARGVLISIAADYAIDPRWALRLDYEYGNWETERGTDRVFASTGEVGATRLNEVNWETSAIMLGIEYRFF